MRKLLVIVNLLVALIFVSCQKDNNAADENSNPDPVLSLKEVGDGKVAVIFNPTNREKLPRIADIYLKYDKSALHFKAHEKGDAIKVADKNLFVKADDSRGVLRITSLSAGNLNKIQGGQIAILTFEKIDDNKDVSVSFDVSKQVFAPAIANDQLTFGDELSF